MLSIHSLDYVLVSILNYMRMCNYKPCVPHTYRWTNLRLQHCVSGAMTYIITAIKKVADSNVTRQNSQAFTDD